MEEKTIYIQFYHEIVAAKVNALIAVCTELLTNESPDRLYFLFATHGGDIDSGIVLFNFLKSLPVEIVMHNMGNVDSIGTVIFLAGEKRYASPYSSFHFHGTQWQFGQSTFTRGQVAEQMSRTLTTEQKLKKIYMDQSQLTEEDIASLYTQGEAKDPAFAQSKGIVHEICNPSIPKGAPLIAVNF